MTYLDYLYNQLNIYNNFLSDVDKTMELLGASIESAYELERIGNYFTIDDSNGDSGELVSKRNSLVGYYNDIGKYVYTAIYDEINRLNNEIAQEESMMI